MANRVNFQEQSRYVKAARVGAVDMGSKNFKFVLGEISGGCVSTTLIKKERLDVGKEITENSGTIGRKKLGEIDAVLTGFAEFCHEREAPKVLAIATSAIRNARNCEQVVDIANTADISLEIADGVREGVVGYLAATGGSPNAFVSDSGSKSTQIAWESTGGIVAHSIPVGYELAYESFIVDSRCMDETLEKHFNFLDGNFPTLPTDCSQFFALAANTITGFVTGEKRTGNNNLSLSKIDIDNKVAELKKLSPKQYRHTVSTLPKANKILPGLVFFAYLTERTGFREILVSEEELPVGLIVEYFANR